MDEKPKPRPNRVRRTTEAAMPNGRNDGMSPEARENIQVLAQRVITVEAAVQEVRGSFAALNSKMDEQARTQGDKIDTLFRSLDQRLGGQIDSISRELGKQVEAVNEKVNSSRIPNYAVILGFVTVAITIFGTIYAFVSTPINNKLSEISQEIAAERIERTNAATENGRRIDEVNKVKISHDEFNLATGRVAEDRREVNARIDKFVETHVTRNEWMERNQSRDHDLQNIRDLQARESVDTQRQIDQLRTEFHTFSNSLGNGRDVIQSLKDEQHRLREQLSDMRMWMSSRTRIPSPTTNP